VNDSRLWGNSMPADEQWVNQYDRALMIATKP
jgi:hypothetical protein